MPNVAQTHRGGELSLDNSTELYGQVTEITLPEVAETTEDVRNGGMSTGIDVGTGYEKMEAEIKLAAINSKLLTSVGVCVGERPKLRWMSSMDNSDSCTPTGLNALLHGRITSVVFGTVKSGDLVDATVKVSVNDRYLLRINDEEIYDIQPINLIHRVGGKDLMQPHRLNMGYAY